MVLHTDPNHCMPDATSKLASLLSLRFPTSLGRGVFERSLLGYHKATGDHGDPQISLIIKAGLSTEHMVVVPYYEESSR